ncbi:hypothetical protein PMIN06_003399 [Paraphaeosphaeria minitans]|uniref:Uncharacterized protein n=1 Tax=Paraphaeosphaeria minitans TaxID=565426 RepID=A0A9P6KR94_9PLEO|nr:hypothetical protein PMIN01_04392 [Paraphaeosphaeria minitans]
MATRYSRQLYVEDQSADAASAMYPLASEVQVASQQICLVESGSARQGFRGATMAPLSAANAAANNALAVREPDTEMERDRLSPRRFPAVCEHRATRLRTSAWLRGVSASDKGGEITVASSLAAQTQARPLAATSTTSTSTLLTHHHYWCFFSPSIPSSFIDNIHSFALSDPVFAQCEPTAALCAAPRHTLVAHVGRLERRCIAPAVVCALTHSKHLISRNRPSRHPLSRLGRVRLPVG